ncbi:MAG: hypothetical protein Fur0010_13270 [Bdellovibrio sp.]
MDKLIFDSVEKINASNPENFKKNYMEKNLPCIITDFAKEWTALVKWNPEYFKKMYGNNLVKVYDASFADAGSTYMGSKGEMPFAEYLDRIEKGEDLRMFLYNIFSHAPELKKDISLPKFINGLSKRFLFMFVGPKGAITQIHFDIDMSHVFHTPVVGRKRFVLYPPEQSKNLYRHPFTVRSYVDVDHPDFKKFPKLKLAKGYEVIVEPGQTLFIPAGYWHHVEYLDAGYAISLRAPNHRLLGKLHGLYNLIIMQMIDRLFNKIVPKAWFQWKGQMAQKLAGQN